MRELVDAAASSLGRRIPPTAVSTGRRWKYGRDGPRRPARLAATARRTGRYERRLARQVAAGGARCVRCGLPIAPGAPFDLGHVDGDRSRYAGPEHPECNRHAGARRGAAVTNAQRRDAHTGYAHSWSRVWAWPIPPDTYVDPEVIDEYLRERRDGKRRH
jgi:hypothetical protein